MSKKYNRIVAFIVINNCNVGNHYEERLLDKLRHRVINDLKNNSVPDCFKIINKLPLSCHGKVDERQLELSYAEPEPKVEYETAFKDICLRLLGLTNEDVEYRKQSTFFQLGGSSIQALQLIREFELATQCCLPEEMFALIFEKPLENCLQFLKSYQLKPSSEKPSVMVNKRKGMSQDIFHISWTYDTKACVDSRPLVFEKR